MQFFIDDFCVFISISNFYLNYKKIKCIYVVSFLFSGEYDTYSYINIMQNIKLLNGKSTKTRGELKVYD